MKKLNLWLKKPWKCHYLEFEIVTINNKTLICKTSNTLQEVNMIATETKFISFHVLIGKDNTWALNCNKNLKDLTKFMIL